MTKQMTQRERNHQELKDMLLGLKAQADLKVLMVEDPSFAYAYVITERDTVLCVSANHLDGYRVAYQYKPSRKYGSGCLCHTPSGDRATSYIHTLEELEALERSGVALAGELDVTHYQNSDEWLNGRWNIDQLVEL